MKNKVRHDRFLLKILSLMRCSKILFEDQVDHKKNRNKLGFSFNGNIKKNFKSKSTTKIIMGFQKWARSLLIHKIPSQLKNIWHQEVCQGEFAMEKKACHMHLPHDNSLSMRKALEENSVLQTI